MTSAKNRRQARAPYALPLRRRGGAGRTFFIAGALSLGFVAALWSLGRETGGQPVPAVVAGQPTKLAAATQPMVAAPVRTPIVSPGYTRLLDPNAIGLKPTSFGNETPLAAGFRSTAPADAAAGGVSVVAMMRASEPAAPTVLPRLVEGIPLPQPRPSRLLAQAAPEQQANTAEEPATAKPATANAKPERPLLRRPRAAVQAAEPSDTRNIFQKLFGLKQEPDGPQLAYAAPDGDAGERRSNRLVPSFGSAQPGTAVYDISARVVHMPNGEKLEAHSGLGDKMDDVRFAHVRMQGVTPPHVYTLKEREALFHGVRAIRLHPVGGSGAIHGRAGLLAHTYLLGPRGDSNGCVSFKDYDKFLQAYLRGEVKRLVVVASLN